MWNKTMCKVRDVWELNEPHFVLYAGSMQNQKQAVHSGNQGEPLVDYLIFAIIRLFN
jgi:hypothetical protein